MHKSIDPNRRLFRAFADHPASVGESYIEHLGHATGFGVRLIGSGLACLVHALLPAAFTHVGSDTIEQLHREMTGRRRTRSRRT